MKYSRLLIAVTAMFGMAADLAATKVSTRPLRSEGGAPVATVPSSKPSSKKCPPPPPPTPRSKRCPPADKDGRNPGCGKGDDSRLP